MDGDAKMSLYGLGIAQAAEEIREGRISSAELVADCLARIDEVEPQVQAWTHLDRDHALAQAKALDEARAHGGATGPLHGIPVGIKDIFDTSDYPTEFGSPIWAGRTPRRDATAVAMLRAAGAVIMGKTVTTEYAFYNPGKARNPYDPTRTPGGSSSGSAAAVAAGAVPGAIGSQTNGSVIRPASFCGVVGFKPSHGMIPRSGALLLSRALDHVGVFARSVPDAALLAQVMFGFDHEDPDTRPVARHPLFEAAKSKPPLPPRFAFVKTPVWDQADQVTKEAFGELAAALGDNASEIELGQSHASAYGFQRIVMDVEMAQNLHRDYEQSAAAMSQVLRELIERGRTHKAIDYAQALAAIGGLRDSLDELFNEFDAIITPAAPGVAPKGLESTGNPIFCTLWTYLGMPAVSVPLMSDEAGLPIGVQIVGKYGNDARLLRSANWLVQTLGDKPKRSRKR